jgi:hypothetical protein
MKLILEDGSAISFEASRQIGAFEAQNAGGEMVEETLKKVSETAGSALKEAIQNIRGKLGEAAPAEIKLEVNVSASAKAGVVFASSAVGGNIKITATWK